jgi:hypothetical protein
MYAVPVEMPVTTPLPEPTVAIEVLLLLHMPPGSVLDSVIVLPWQPVDGPSIFAGALFTLTTVVVVQLVTAAVKVIAAVPLLTPVTIPVAAPIVATAVLLLAHDNVEELFVSAAVVPTHTVVLPDIAAGGGLTVTIAVFMQPGPVA